jgi:hypothetical protein
MLAVNNCDVPVALFVSVFVMVPLDPCNYNEVGERGNRKNAMVRQRLPLWFAPNRFKESGHMCRTFKCAIFTRR